MGHNRRLIIVAGAAVALTLTGCAGSSEPGQNGEADGPITLQYWSGASGIDERVAVWNEANPDVQVEVSEPASGEDFPVKVLAAVRAGEAPDIVTSEYAQLPTYVSAGVVADLESVRDELTDAYAENVLDSVTLDGTIYGVPQDLGPSMLFYRTDVFDQSGLEPAGTWEEFRQLAEKVRALDGDRYITNLSSIDFDLFLGLASQTGAQWWDYVDGEWTVNFEDEATAEVVEFWQGLIEDDLVSTYLRDSPEYNEAVASGQIVSILSGPWMAGKLYSAFPDTVGLWGAAQVPQWNEDEFRTFSRGGSADVIMADSEHRDAALEFSLWLNASDEGAEGLVEIDKFTAATFGQELDRTPPAVMPDDTEFWTAVTESAQGLVTVQWGPNTQVAFTAVGDALGRGIEAGSWSDFLPSVQTTVENDLK